jgi:hypothetical protein
MKSVDGSLFQYALIHFQNYSALRFDKTKFFVESLAPRGFQ